MTDIPKVSAGSFVAMIIGSLIFLIVPVLIAIIWTVKKKEKFSTILIGAATFILFALILEKPIQNALIFPTIMGLPDHAAARFIDARPLLWVVLVGLFPGVFEETGRFVAYKTVLKKRKNRETSLSYGIGHAGCEVIVILGLTYISYIMIALMMNTGAIQTTIDQVKELAPDQLETTLAQIEAISMFSFSDLFWNIFERIFAVLYHIGASVLVFYACRDKKNLWLYPLAIILHTLLDGFAALSMKGLITLDTLQLELIIAVFGSLVFFGSYFLLYKKDEITEA